ncbi:S8 family serine peptidase [Candidatus Hodarchaeum mangrovi]
MKNNKSLRLIFVIILIVISFNSNISQFIASQSLPWHLEQISIEEAWLYTKGLENITIAVIDTGVDFNHPELYDSAWINRGEIPDNGIDDDQNGFIDDIYGWDFYNNDNDPLYHMSDPLHHHGTFISGIIAAKHDQNDVEGISPNVKIMALRIIGFESEGNITLANNLVAALDYAAKMGATIISLSLTMDFAVFGLQEIIESIALKNIPIIAPTGNNMSNGQDVLKFPACYPEVISVGASNLNRERAYYSNYGAHIEILAPVGDSPIIKSTIPQYSYSTGIGTSYATPQVAAVIALIKSINYRLTTEEIRYILHSTCSDVNQTGWDKYTGWGILNASTAVLKTLEFSGIPTSPNKLFSFPSLYFFTIFIPLLILRYHKQKINK